MDALAGSASFKVAALESVLLDVIAARLDGILLLYSYRRHGPR
jgi:hypothetical protein